MSVTDTPNTIKTVPMVELPEGFYLDHRYRDLPEQGTSEIVATKRRRVTVLMDAPALHDLYTDALYYTDPATARDLRECGNGGLVTSARACLKALRAQLPEQIAVLDAEIAAQRKRWLTR